MFGEFIKRKRIENELSLREFCRQLNEDASNWSKIERQLVGPPKDEAKLKKIAGILGIKQQSTDWDTLHDLANIDSGKIPEYIMSDKEVLQALPIFFRTIGSVKPTTEELEELIKNLKSGK